MRSYRFKNLSRLLLFKSFSLHLVEINHSLLRGTYGLYKKLIHESNKKCEKNRFFYKTFACIFLTSYKQRIKAAWGVKTIYLPACSAFPYMMSRKKNKKRTFFSWLRIRLYLFLNAALRFSTKACMPSLRSCNAKDAWNCRFSNKIQATRVMAC